MTLFDDILKRPGSEGAGQLSVPGAVAAVLMSAMVSDGEVSAGEAKWTNYELPNLRVFRGLGPEELRTLTREVFERVQRVGAEALLAEAAPAVPSELRAFAFANAVDLVLADDEASEAEREFIDTLQVTLEVEPDLARRIIQVMVVKHGPSI